MEVIAEQPWSWMLFANGGRRLLSVVCGGVGIYEIEFELTDDEVAVYGRSGNTYLDELAGAARSTPTAFETRRLSGLLSGAEATTAVAPWRKRQSLG
jgi:hypothetical protein